jgi:RND family efflux transporter MFP subunit
MLPRPSRLPALLLLPLAAAAGCGPRTSPPPPPPPKVTVAQPVRRDVTEYREYAGRLDPVESVEVRARVRGFLQTIHFKEGTEVKKDDLLYEIDPQPFQAELERAKAEAARLEALLRQARSEADRVARLRGTGAVAEEEYIAKAAARDEAKANLDRAHAVVRSAELELGYTNIRAQIGGRIGRTLVTEGNLVGYNEPTLLTHIVRMDPLYVLFEAPEGDYLEYQTLMREQGVPSAAEGSIPIRVGLVSDRGRFPHQGVLNYRDNRIDPGTGTVLLRGQLDNPQRILVPGLYARVRVPFGRPAPRLLVPEQALAADQGGRYVLVVRPDNTVAQKRVTTGETLDGLIVIPQGLAADDWVIVNGLQKARPGAPFEVVSGER